MIGQMKHILAAEQKKTDFKPEDENNVLIQYTNVSKLSSNSSVWLEMHLSDIKHKAEFNKYMFYNVHWIDLLSHWTKELQALLRTAFPSWRGHQNFVCRVRQKSDIRRYTSCHNSSPSQEAHI